jgi:hypothetical protein
MNQPLLASTYKVCLLVKSADGYLDPETLVENCAPKFSIEKAVAYKPLPAEIETHTPSSGSAANQPALEEVDEEDSYSYSDADYSHLYKKLANIYEDEVDQPAEGDNLSDL